MGHLLDFKCPDGSTASGWFAPSTRGAEGPGVVVIHEWWGLRDEMKRLADRLADAGYNALVPDLYHGKTVHTADAAGAAMQALDWPRALVEIRGALAHLKSAGAKVAVMGFCMGGALAVATGVTAPEVDAVDCFYGIPPAEAFDPAKMRVPFLGHFAEFDDWVTKERVDALKEGLVASQVPYEIMRYNGVHHAFFNDARPEVYSKDTSAVAWNLSLEFFAQHLAPSTKTSPQ